MQAQVVGPNTERAAAIKRTRFKKSKIRKAVAIITILLLLCVLIALLFRIIINTTTQSLALKQSPCGIWYSDAGPAVGELGNGINAVSAISKDDVWMVGSKRSMWGVLGEDQVLTIHWDGQQFNDNSPSIRGHLEAVSALDSDNVWAVGNNDKRELIIHWDGKHWNTADIPNAGSTTYALMSIKAVADDNVWVTGRSVINSYEWHTLILHWNGIDWTSSQISGLGNADSTLYSIDAIAANDIWAAGETSDPSSSSSGTLTNTHPLLAHWDGASWSAYTIYNVDGSLSVISASSANDVWSGGSAGGPLLLHWDGKRWNTISNTSLSMFEPIQALTAASPDNVWIAGAYWGDELAIAHWDGTKWSRILGPKPKIQTDFRAMTVDHEGNVWAGGFAYNNEDDWIYYALTARFIPNSCQ